MEKFSEGSSMYRTSLRMILVLVLVGVGTLARAEDKTKKRTKVIRWDVRYIEEPSERFSMASEPRVPNRDGRM